MALQSGHGGYVKTTVAVPVGRWSGNWRSRLGEVTKSDSGGGTRFKAVVQDNQWSFECPRDDVAFPEAAGLTQGADVATLIFKLGAGDKADILSNTTVEDVSPTCDNQGDVVRVTVSGKGGTLAPNQTIPS